MRCPNHRFRASKTGREAQHFRGAHLALCLSVVLHGCGAAVPDVETSEASPPRRCEEQTESWVHLPHIVSLVQPARPLDARQLQVVADVAASLADRADVIELRVEGHGCDGEDSERATARAELVRATLMNGRGLGLESTVVGYAAGGRGCECPCDSFAVPGTEDTSKKWSCDFDDCARRGSDSLRVEFSVQ